MGGDYTSTTEHTTLDMAVCMAKYIQNELVSYTNPKGRLTIKILELAVLVMQWLVMEYVVESLRFKKIVSFNKNTSAVTQKYRGSALTSIPAARLLCLLALRQQ